MPFLRNVDFVVGRFFFYLKMTDKSGPKFFTDLVERLLFSSPSNYLYIFFFLFGAKPKSTSAFLVHHSWLATLMKLAIFFLGGEFKLDAKMYGSFEAFPL